MSTFKFKFGVEEHPDAESFILYDITGIYDVTENPEGWGGNFNYGDVDSAYFLMKEHSTKKVLKFDLPDDAELWEVGIEFKKSDGTAVKDSISADSKFADGAYEFEVLINTESVAKRSFGFYAQIKEDVMKESLSYRPERKRVYRELIWEKLRLLDNLFYSTETDQIKHFVENLSQLKKLR